MIVFVVYQTSWEVVRRPRLADGCRHVYLDFGSNVGVQIRKVYEVDYFNMSTSATRRFEQFFGGPKERVKNRDVCSFGFEPNPLHAKRLKALEACYNSKGWRTKYYTSTAITTKDKKGGVKFYTKGSDRSQYWISALEKTSDKDVEWDIDALDIAKFVMDEVKDRLIPAAAEGQRPPSVLMKMDIEGEEINVVPWLLSTGALCFIDHIMIELHINKNETVRKFWSNFNHTLQDQRGKCKLASIVKEDDEQWGKDLSIPAGCQF
jgi:hypothetical protein